MTTIFDSYIDVLTESIEIKQSGGMEAYRLVDFSGNNASADEKPLGVTRFAGSKGSTVPVGIIGIFPVEAASAITVGSKIGAAASDGKAQAISGATAADLGKTCAYALTAATKAGDVIRALFVP